MGADNGASQPDEVFDLDALEREDAKPPFRFRTGGHDFMLVDPSELDAGSIGRLATEDPVSGIRILLGDQWDDFDAAKVPMWRCDKLMMAWATHYGLDLGESQASPSSSPTTAGPSRRTSRASTTAVSRTSARAG